MIGHAVAQLIKPDASDAGDFALLRRLDGRAVDGFDNARSHDIASFVLAGLDDLEPAYDFATLGAVLHPLQRRDDLPDGIALDGNLSIDSSGQRGVSAWTGRIYAAVVNNDDSAFEAIT